MQKKKKMLSVLLVLAAGCLWGTMGFWVRNLEQAGFSSMEIVLFRVYGALFLIGAGAAVCRSRAFVIKGKDLWCFLGSGLVSVVFFNYCYFTTIMKTSLSLAAVLLYTSPIFVILLSAVLFREKLTRKKVFAMALAFLGCLLATGVLGQKLVLSPGGILTGLGAGLGYGLYSIFSRYAMERGYGSVTITIYTFLFASVGVLPFVDFGHLAGGFAALGSDRRLWFFVAGLIVFTTVLAYLCYTKGLEGLENGQAAVIACIEPVMASLVGLIIFGETFTPAGALGAVLVLLAVLLMQA